MRFPKLKLLAALTFGAFVQTTVAADYPSKPVTMVIP
jgi:tripartite-type tricarboxylate transporter receptor subunit TctC